LRIRRPGARPADCQGRATRSQQPPTQFVCCPSNHCQGAGALVSITPWHGSKQPSGSPLPLIDSELHLAATAHLEGQTSQSSTAKQRRALRRFGTVQAYALWTLKDRFSHQVYRRSDTHENAAASATHHAHAGDHSGLLLDVTGVCWALWLDGLKRWLLALACQFRLFLTMVPLLEHRQTKKSYFYYDVYRPQTIWI